MSTHLLAVVVGIPLAWHLALVAATYYDAGRVGMDRRKWAAITFFVPLLGFFAYLFERSERSYDPEDDPYAGGGYDFHESRADDVRHPARASSGDDDGRPIERGPDDVHHRERRERADGDEGVPDERSPDDRG